MKDTPIQIAAILACHNRKPLTLSCLEALYTQQLSRPVQVSTYLLDDGSTDGTAEAVENAFTHVNVIKADGSLFWNEGMRTAFAAALEEGADFYLWLNDDTTLYPDAVNSLLNTYDELSTSHPNSIIVGSVQDPDSLQLTYGGMRKCSSWHPFHFELITPTDRVQKCDVMNGNCVLIPDAVARHVGNMDAGYSHAIGDIDYSLKAGKNGVRVWIAPGFVGTCSTNPVKGSWLDTSLPLQQRWKHMKSPKGLPPGDWLLFTRKHAGLLWPLFGFMPYIRLFSSAILARFRSSNPEATL